MIKSEAMQHGLGYAAGREDASGVKTANGPTDSMGWMRFAEAYAQAWQEYNDGQRFFMTNARDAYDAWQATEGVSIFRPSEHDLCANCGSHRGSDPVAWWLVTDWRTEWLCPKCQASYSDWSEWTVNAHARTIVHN